MKIVLFLIALAAAAWAQDADDDSTASEAVSPDTVRGQPAAVPAPTPGPMPDSASAAVSDSSANPAPSDSSHPAVQKPKTHRRDKRVSVDKTVETIATYQGNVNQLKSPKKAFFMSFIYPGAGQYYARAGWVRIGIPVAVELSSYVSIFVIRSKYNDLVTKFEHYADQHFEPQKLIAWQDYILANNDSTVRWLLEGDTMPFAHREDFLKTYNQKTNDYYEVVGKYDEFVQGWDDVGPDMVGPNAVFEGIAYPDSFGYIAAQSFGTNQDYRYRGLAVKQIVTNTDGSAKDTIYLYYHDNDTRRPFYYGRSQHQLDYVNLRNDANDMAGLTKVAFYTMLINRMISAVDAVFAANAYNRRITGEKLSFIDHIHVEPRQRPTFPHFTNGVSVSYRF